MTQTTHTRRASATNGESTSKTSRSTRHRGGGCLTCGCNKGKFIIGGIIAVIVAALTYLIWPKPHKEVKPFTEVMPTKSDPPKSVTIFLDNSSSMMGYVNGDAPAFIAALSELRNIYPGTDAVYYDKDSHRHKLAGDDFIDSQRRHLIAYKGESLLHNDLARIANEVGQSKGKKLMLYITDGIMSFSNKEILEDPNKNIAYADELKNYVTSAFRDRGNIGVSVYQLSSVFKGVYYCYNNDRVDNLNSIRYYYVVAVGSPQVLAHLKQNIGYLERNTKSHFHPLGEWHSIEKIPINSGLKANPNALTRHEGDFSYEPKHVNKTCGGQLEFSIDYEMFQNYALNTDSIAKHTHIMVNGRLLPDSVTNDKAKRQFTFRLSLNGGSVVLSKQDSVRVYTDYIVPSWIDRSSTGNDTYMKSSLHDARTFLLDRFIEGIQKGLLGTATQPLLYDRRFRLQQEN